MRAKCIHGWEKAGNEMEPPLREEQRSGTGRTWRTHSILIDWNLI